MSVQCHELFDLPSLKALELIAGKGGLTRKIRWIYDAEVIEDIRDITEWLYGGELVIVTGIGIRDKESVFLELIDRINRKNLAGLIVYIGGPYIDNIPDSVIALANELLVPLFTLPWEVPLVKVTRDICTYIINEEKKANDVHQLLQKILFLKWEDSKSIKEQAVLIGYRPELVYRVIIVELDDFENFINENNIKENTVKHIKEQFFDIVKKSLKEGYSCFQIMVGDSIISLVGQEDYDKNKLDKLLLNLLDDIKKYITLSASIGVGQCYKELPYYRQSMQEARQALEILKQKRGKGQIIFYEDMGIFTVFTEIKKKNVLKNIYLTRLDKLYKYDNLNQTNLVDTLKIFLNNSKNMYATAKALFIHRNTLRYRLDRIEQLTGYSLNNQEDCFHFQLAFYINEFLE